MNNFFIILFCLSIQSISAQMIPRRIDSFLSAANKFENDNLFPKAQAIYNMLEPIITVEDRHYGEILEKIYYYALNKNQMDKALEYYNKIINSKLDDREVIITKTDEPYKNYRYKATKALAESYYIKRNLYKCLEYIDLAEYSMPYQTTLLSNYKAQKIDLALSKSKVYEELLQKDSAFAVLLKRTLEYDYDKQLKQFTSSFNSNYEKELISKIFSFYPGLKEKYNLKKRIDASFHSCEFKNNEDGTSKIKLEFNEMTQIIQIQTPLESKEDCISYLRNSPFYISLSKETGGQGK